MPDAVYDRITRSAAELGLSRSELLARAATSYLDQLEADSLTARINAALEQVGADDEVDDVVAAGKRQILGSDEDW
jgi:hypothetical protein